MAGILRGEVYWADLDPTRGSEQRGTRPVVVLSDSLFNSKSGTVIAMAITSRKQRAGFPLTLKLAKGALPKESWVKIGQVRTLSTKSLSNRLGEVSVQELENLIDGLNVILGH